jgi:anti-anti-sigma factor
VNDQLAIIDSERRDDQVFIRLRGEIDLSNAEIVQKRLERAVEGCQSVFIDLSAVEYIDSQGLRLLKRLSNKLRGGATLELIAPPESVARDVLELTRMSDEISTRDSLPA